MARKDIIMLSQKELKRLHVIQKILDGVLKHIEGAEKLSLSDRQITLFSQRKQGDKEANKEIFKHDQGVCSAVISFLTLSIASIISSVILIESSVSALSMVSKSP